MKYIGLSLSLCIKDILDRLVKEDDVYALVTGIEVRDNDWTWLIDYYGRHYWGNNPEAAAILYRLINSGRIVQPRVNGQVPPTLTNGHWLTLEAA